MDRADLIVVGAGTAGIPCALAAVETGARVVLVDKAEDVGGTLHVSGGHLSAAGARRQRERGIEDSPEQHLADLERISGGTLRRDLAVLAVEHAAATIDWLASAGFEFCPETPRLVYGHEPYSVPRTYYGPEQGRSILAVLRRLLEAAVATGRLDLRTGARVEALLGGMGSGARAPVTGVRLADGTQLSAPAVVLATGGFGAAPDLFAELEGAPLVSAAWPTSTGDGLRLSRAVGAAVAGQGTYLPTFGGLPPPDGSGRVQWSDRPLLVAAERPPWEIYVDRVGQRFVAEDEQSIDRKERALARVPGRTFWTVFDSVALERSRPMVAGWEPADLQAQANRRPGVFSASTLEELARAAGIDSAGLVEQVARYNGSVATGRDSQFGREHLPAPIARAPYYALQNHGVTLITFSGVDVDAQLRVRREDGSTVPGLYAIGEVLGAGATTGNAFCGGMLLTPALTFGRVLGSRLAAAATLLR